MLDDVGLQHQCVASFNRIAGRGDGELKKYLENALDYAKKHEEIIERARLNETGWLAAIDNKGKYLATEADGLRDANLQRLSNQRATPTAGIFFNDMLLAMRRIRNHSINIAEAWLGKK